ncbi:HAD-IIA family hydrolase [bacterium]|jgi:HAD superfamily hydrolase (TIGR01450 family)|nr:HAD-IIA family hydrolase [bacterium]MBT3850564.1 HAD-IIA family hydrolase [bacterium]MBT4434804.1 HAD-IIA family hydrolase [bacterium]
MNLIEKYSGFIFDLDGVIYLDKVLLPFSKNIINTISRNNKPYLFMTNDSTLSPAAYSTLLKSLGIPCAKRQIITPLTNFFDIVGKNKKSVNVLALTSKKIKNFLKKNARINLVDAKNDYKKAELVLVAGSMEFNYEDLMYACLSIQNGSRVYATSVDNTYPSKLGNLPATGSIVAAIRKATACKVINLGKPSLKIFNLALKQLDCPRQETLMIGDNLKTDIYGAQSSAIEAALVLTGKTNIKTAKESKIKASFILNNLKDMNKRK